HAGDRGSARAPRPHTSTDGNGISKRKEKPTRSPATPRHCPSRITTRHPSDRWLLRDARRDVGEAGQDLAVGVLGGLQMHEVAGPRHAADLADIVVVAIQLLQRLAAVEPL